MRTVSPGAGEAAAAAAATGMGISSSSVPIATSTPVNAAAGPVSPPPLQSHQQQQQHEPAAGRTSVAQYPAVLKGSAARTTASPPNPNLVPSGKVPPPVPPRGSVSGRGKPSSGERGDDEDDAARLHGLGRAAAPRVMHETLAPPRQPTPAVRQPPSRPPFPARDPSVAVVPEELRTHRRNTEYVHYGPLRPRLPEDEDPDEFVSVERVDDSYVIRTSPYPFRPERGRRRADAAASPRSEAARPAGHTPSISMPKFTYFINPAANPELLNWKMSRKDKKHSETYSERTRRLQEEQRRAEIEAGYPRLLLDDARVQQVAVTETLSQAKGGSTLLKMIRVKYSQRKKLSPLPALKRRLDERVAWLGGPAGAETAASCAAPTIASPARESTNPPTGRTVLGHAYPEWGGAKRIFRRREGSNPNVIKSPKDQYPETLNASMPDEQYKTYHLDDLSESRRNRDTHRNSSFLHGYSKK